jgi:UDP-glucose 4-epimerase
LSTVQLLTKKTDDIVIIIDNLLNSNENKLDKIKDNIFKENIKNLFYYKIEMLNYDELNEVFIKHNINIVIHLAGLKAVSESINNPINYYENNIIITLNLIKIMEKYNCKNLIFSSSSTVYGNLKAPYKENMIVGQGITNPYGKTKYMIEEILKDLYISNNSWNIILLRYFNPVSHKTNELKETPNGIPNNLFPYLVKVHTGELKQLSVYGNDYETRDGTCIRDFIHVVDLADGHIAAAQHISNNELINGTKIGLKIYNLGTGYGISVKELIDKFEEVNNTKINYKFVDRRNGDLDISYADVSLAEKELKWKCKKTLEHIVLLS